MTDPLVEATEVLRAYFHDGWGQFCDHNTDEVECGVRAAELLDLIEAAGLQIVAQQEAAPPSDTPIPTVTQILADDRALSRKDAEAIEAMYRETRERLREPSPPRRMRTWLRKIEHDENALPDGWTTEPHYCRDTGCVPVNEGDEG